VSSYLGKNLLKLPWNNFRGTLKKDEKKACFSGGLCYNVVTQDKKNTMIMPDNSDAIDLMYDYSNEPLTRWEDISALIADEIAYEEYLMELEEDEQKNH